MKTKTISSRGRIGSKRAEDQLRRLVDANFCLLSHARAHLIDLGRAGEILELELEVIAPGCMARLEELCPAPQMSLREWTELRTMGLVGLRKFQARSKKRAA